MAKLYDTLSKFGRGVSEDLTKVWDIGLGAVNPSKIWDSAAGNFVHNKINDFTLGIKIANGTTINAIDQGTWTTLAIVNLSNVGTGTVSFDNISYVRVNSTVHATITMNALTFGAAGSGSFDLQFSGLPGLLNSTNVYGGAHTLVDLAGAVVAGSCGVASTSGSSTDISFFLDNPKGAAVSNVRLMAHFSYTIA